MSHALGTARRHVLSLAALAAALVPYALHAQAVQKQDSVYTAAIHQYLTDPRITTELVDHLPASSTVPTPLKFLGHIIGQPGYLTHTADIHKYLRAIAAAAPNRAKVISLGTTEEGREMVAIVISSDETMKNIDKYRGYIAALTDPRKTTEAQAQMIIKAAKPIYWITSGMHSTETGGPEALMELAYRLVVEETPFVQDIRNGVITVITPIVEPDGRERIVDACDARAVGQPAQTPYWGHYVEHDDNRDGMGQMLLLTQNIEKFGLEWHPTVLHDLHESEDLLYVSTGTGPYNEALDPLTVDEWWWMAENDIIEMTKRGVPGVWTYDYYDGWVPNYMFYVVHAHNAVGRFYEVNSFGSNCSAQMAASGQAVANAGGGGRGGGGGGRGGAAGGGGGRGGRGGPGGAAATADAGVYAGDLGAATPDGTGQRSKEWFRPNPDPGDVNWGPRANTNIQESALLFALHNAGEEKQRFLSDYWVKSKNSVNRGINGPIRGWVLPASQHSKENVAEAINELMDQGLEFSVANADFKAGNIQVHKGDWVIRGDQPFRGVADIYFSIQNYPTTNPAPYDDTGWSYQMMRDLTIEEVRDSSFLGQPMTKVSAHVTAAGGISGAGSTVIVDHAGDNMLVTFRFKFANTKMSAAEAPFDAAGHHFGAGSIIIANADRAALDPALKQYGLAAWAVDAMPNVKTHALSVPRIGYIHSWTSTQDEGWVRGALDYYKIPYKYFGENVIHTLGDVKSKYDIIIWPSGGAVGQDQPTTGTPTPWKSTKVTPSFGTPDSTDDTRGGLGPTGLQALYQFVQEGGVVITEGSTASVFPDYHLTPGVSVAPAPGLVAKGTILRGIITDMSSPIVYGMAVNQMPVYYSQGAVLDAGVPQAAEGAATDVAAGGRGGRGAGGGGGRGGGASVYQNPSPMASKDPGHLSHWDPTAMWNVASAAPAGAGAGGFGGRGGGGGGRGGRGGAGGEGTVLESMRPRVVMQFPADSSDMLLSGVLAGGQMLSNRAQIVDDQIGKGHVVMFAIRPFWRWQTQGTFILGFNTIMNWDHLDAGKAAPAPPGAPGGHQ